MLHGAIPETPTSIGARAAEQEGDDIIIKASKLAMAVFALDPLTDLDNLTCGVLTVERERNFERTAFMPLIEADISDG